MDVVVLCIFSTQPEFVYGVRTPPTPIHAEAPPTLTIHMHTRTCTHTHTRALALHRPMAHHFHQNVKELNRSDSHGSVQCPIRIRFRARSIHRTIRKFTTNATSSHTTFVIVCIGLTQSRTVRCFPTAILWIVFIGPLICVLPY